ncbi:MAG: Pyocin activator protein PrtN [Rhizobiales bacterium]|nr:Pyocin activator protein PrtN [Hyphomicrobiales bacterium]
MAQYNGKAVIPLEDVCRDYFAPLGFDKFKVKLSRGEIDLPVVRLEDSQKGAKGVHLADLAAYIDHRRDLAVKEMRQMGTI